MFEVGNRDSEPRTFTQLRPFVYLGEAKLNKASLNTLRRLEARVAFAKTRYDILRKISEKTKLFPVESDSTFTKVAVFDRTFSFSLLREFASITIL
jgi:hypothetical protein